MGKKEKLQRKINKLKNIEEQYNQLNKTIENKKLDMILNDIKQTQPEFYEGFYSLFNCESRLKKSALTRPPSDS